MNKTQKSVSKAKSFTSAEGCATDKGLINKHSEREVPLGFYSWWNTALFSYCSSQGSQSFLIDYRWGKGQVQQWTFQKSGVEQT
jgi:hypothetical protein